MTIHDIAINFITGVTAVTIDPSRSVAFCARPYPGHKNGCPNFGKLPDCPPKALFYPRYFQSQATVVAARFDFKNYLQMMHSRHPTWGSKALRNSLYWQGHLRAVLKKEVESKLKPGQVALYKPEANGVDVTATCAKVGIFLEWPPVNYVHRIALVANSLV